MRRARFALCTLVVSAFPLMVSEVPPSDASAASATTAVANASSPGSRSVPDLTLSAQTPWVTPTAPWFTLAFNVGAIDVPVGELRVQVTFYGRINNVSQLQQDTGSAPDRGVLTRVSVPVTSSGTTRAATACVTVLPNSSATAPTPSPGTTGACAPSDQNVILGCAPNTGYCPDVYPISVALVRASGGTALSRFTTFMTYQGPNGPTSTGGQLRVSWVVPIEQPAAAGALAASGRRQTEQLVSDLAANRGVPVTLAVTARSVADLAASGGREGRQAVERLAELTNPPGADQLLPESYAPVNLATLVGTGLSREIGAQMTRSTEIFHAAGLHPSAGPWMDAASSFTTANSVALAAGMHLAGVSDLVLSDSDLQPGGLADLTFAQPFTLGLARDVHITAAVTNGMADSRFTAFSSDPVLAANQLLAILNFFHFENASLVDPRGVVITPPAGWQSQSAFVTTLLTGLTSNPALLPVTVDQLLSAVPQGGNDEPIARDLQGGSPPGSQSIKAALAARIATGRVQLSSYGEAVQGHPAQLMTLDDALLSTEDRSFKPAQRATAVTAYDEQFGRVLSAITLGAERTITFTSRTAPIPVTVLSSAPYDVTVVMTLSSDKFSFPQGNSRRLRLDRPITPVRVQARARTSGDRLPVEITLRTPNGQLVIAHAQLTVRSTAISLVGIALTVLAGLTLLLWWARTWRRGRRRRPRAH